MSFADPLPLSSCTLKEVSDDPSELARRLLLRMGSEPSVEMGETLYLALCEVVHAILMHAGNGARKSLRGVIWDLPGAAMLSLSYRGPVLPESLLTNWNKLVAPSVLGPLPQGGWGWLLVREAFDNVIEQSRPQGQVLLLERRFGSD